MPSLLPALLLTSACTLFVATGFGITPSNVAMESRQEGGMPAEVLARITPGKQHADMAWYLGDWDVSIKFTMPGMPAMPASKATCHYEWLIDGRWMMSRMKGSLMGSAAEWVHVHGYNNMTMSYETIGFDNMSTDTKVSYGNAVTQDGKTLGFQGTLNEYLNGQIYKPFRTVQQRTGDDSFDLQIWDPEIGPNGAQVILMQYKRAK